MSHALSLGQPLDLHFCAMHLLYHQHIIPCQQLPNAIFLDLRHISPVV